jgi:hypothetical protein
MKRLALLLGLIFFIVGVFTLTNYGINWDTINHLPRGQAYLNYYLTGNKDYSNLQPYFKGWQTADGWYWQNPSALSIKADIPLNKVPQRSLYENDDFNFKYFVQNDGYGHPPLSDILSSFFNVLLFQKLRIINDIDSYHVYGILLAAALVSLIFYWVSKKYGKVSGLIASLSLATYPLFWSESHFNTEKDVPETVYWSFFLFCIWKGISEKKIKWILVSGVFFGLAVGTKFNILFSIFVIAPWAITFLIMKKEKLISKVNVKILLSGVIAFGIGCVIFVGSWPYLWPDVITRVQSVISFYKDIGVATGVADLRFVGPFGMSTYPIYWIITTTPPVVLILAVVGIFFAIRNFKKNKQLSILFLLWFFVPILRVIWHGANIYGGIRQIMEYIPGLAILSGIGGGALVSKLRSKKILAGGFILIIIFSLLIPIAKTHPNENVYFNFLVGGLSGAKAKEIPSWGNSFGAAYRQAIVWIDNNVPKNSNLTFAYELIPNVPRIWIRQDINLTAQNRSGYLRLGEYAFTLDYQGTSSRSYYDSYLNTFLNPVYQSKVDGVPVVSVWKNDTEHLKKPWIEKEIPKVKLTKREIGLQFDLGNDYPISRLDMTYNQINCQKLTSGYFEVSPDNKSWTRLAGVLPDDWAIAVLKEQPNNGKFIQPFTGENVRYINFNMTPSDTCLMKNYTSVKFFYLE